MFVRVNGVRLYFDVEGAALVPDGPRMREKPTLILLHGGPGADHSVFKPVYSALAGVAQVVYLDHRGNGRSEPGPRAGWTLAQWGDDVAAFCDALGIVRPIVAGTSFGGFVAQSYATRHPEHHAGLILTSTAARFDFAAVFDAFGRLGGPAARAAAEAYWLTPSSENRARYGEICVPLYFATPDETGARRDWSARMMMRDDVALHFNGRGNEHGRMDFRAALANIRRPTLVMAGEDDPITPVAFSEEIAACLPSALCRFARFANAGHGVAQDAPGPALAAIREFIAEIG